MSKACSNSRGKPRPGRFVRHFAPLVANKRPRIDCPPRSGTPIDLRRTTHARANATDNRTVALAASSSRLGDAVRVIMPVHRPRSAASSINSFMRARSLGVSLVSSNSSSVATAPSTDPSKNVLRT